MPTLALLVSLGLATPAVAAPPSAYPSPAAAKGATYLANRLASGGNHLSVSAGGTNYTDYGLTLDAVTALTAAKAGSSEADKALNYVAAHLGDYVGKNGEQYAGATAKALYVAAVNHRLRSGAWRGVHLVSRLRGLMGHGGRYRDKSQYGDYSNIFSQAFAVLALKVAQRPAPAIAVRFLERQQCPGGGFREALASAACVRAGQAETDATSIAVQGLLAAPATARRHRVLSAAGRYLARQQRASGAFDGGSTTPGANTNSTGLAALGLAATGHAGAARRADRYLRSLQYGCHYERVLRGGIAYDAAAYRASRRAGSRPTDQDTRATTQAVLGLAGVQLVRLTPRGSTPGVPAPWC